MEKKNSRFASLFLMVWLKFRSNPKKTKKMLTQAGIGNDMKILDYGCGIGSYSIEAANITGDMGEVFAADNDPKMLEKVKKSSAGMKNIVALKVDSYKDIKDNDYDFILLMDVLHFFDNPHEVLDYFLGRLKSNGRILIKFDHFTSSDIEELINSAGCEMKQNLKGRYWLLGI